MSLSNPNKVVTEERLNEYHNTILPYLGGMPDILANKFSRADLYSTDEKMVGRWIDGKPLYQKTYSLTAPSSTGNHNLVDLPSNFETIHISDWFLMSDDSVMTDYMDTFFVWIRYKNNPNGNKIACQIMDSGLYNKPVYITIQYTKTTDSSVEIGLDTDYSTDEKIVGTWVDGKPIYQKTFTGTFAATAVDTTIGSIANFSALVNISGWGQRSGGRYDALPNAGTVCFVSASGDVCVWTDSNAMFSQPCLLTVQYTKTTD